VIFTLKNPAGNGCTSNYFSSVKEGETEVIEVLRGGKMVKHSVMAQ
jgi:hypothetical protein|tara:strand:+ start:1990 stop:2127 length:138 start_codon:yes stop_codon:yes gene_type:complete